MTSHITLKSSDDLLFTVDLGVARMSKVIKTMLDVLQPEVGKPDEDQTPIPLLNVDSATLTKVIEWCDYHHKNGVSGSNSTGGERPSTTEAGARSGSEMDQWDRNFLRVNLNTLFNLINASNYLDIRGLLMMSCRTVADRMKGKSSQDLRRMFNIENDLTHEEENEIQQGWTTWKESD